MFKYSVRTITRMITLINLIRDATNKRFYKNWQWSTNIYEIMEEESLNQGIENSYTAVFKPYTLLELKRI